MHLPECMHRRTFIIAIGAAMNYANFGCRSQPIDRGELQQSNLAGRIKWVDFDAPRSQIEEPLGQVFGAAFLLPEEQYKSIGYKGPPIAYPKTREEVLQWHRQMPDEWWSSASIPYEWWGRESGEEPTEVTLPLAAPVHLLRAHLDSRGSFEFKNIPHGRHTLFIRWGKDPDPQNNISGPFEVVIDRRSQIDQVFPVNAFDIIDT